MMVASHPPLEVFLIHEARGGNAEAKDRLVREVYHRIVRYFLRLTRGHEEQALGGAQETMVRILRALPDLREVDRFIPWALRIATNVWRDRLRGRQDVELTADAAVSDEPDRRQEVHDLLRRVDTLPSPYRNALDQIDHLTFSPDGKTLAYVGREGVVQILIVNGKRHHTAGVIGVPVFSPDSSTFAFVAARGTKHLAVVGREIGEKFSTISAMTFSPDAKSVAYRAERFGKGFVMAGKALSEEFDAVVSGPFFSPDSKKVAFVVRQGEELRSKVMDVR